MSTGAGSMVLKEGNPLALQFAMFLPALMSLCSPEQQEKWFPRAQSLQILGTYAQVSNSQLFKNELGYSNLILTLIF